MSTVKIKTEPTTTTTVDVKVKLEPSLSTADIKLEQHTSDIDTKVEPDSDTYSEEDDIKSEDDDDDTDQNQFTITPKNQRRFICKHPGCGRSFNSISTLKRHQHEHGLQVELNIYKKTYTLARQSLNDRWLCPITGCKLTYKLAGGICGHIRKAHGETIGQHTQQQQTPIMKTRYKYYFMDVDDFYVNGVRCGYHSTIGVFICHECRLVPECLLTHLQQKHGYGEKSIDNSALPDSAVNASADPNTNQHISNSHLVAAISQPYRQQHPDILQGWLCVTSNCGYCGQTTQNKGKHRNKIHSGKQITSVPALVLRLSASKKQSSCFLITRLDQASGVVTTSSNTMKRHRLDYSHNGLNVQDESEITDTSNQMPYWKCDYDSCGFYFNSADQLGKHRREHKLEVAITARGKTFTLSRQSLNDRWPCPVPDCETNWKTVTTIHVHILNTHAAALKHKRANSEDDDDQQHQQPIIKKRQLTIQYFNVDEFYVSGTRCGYHTTTGVFFCYECRLVPESLLAHLQQKHGYDGKLIDIAFIPESVRINRNDPSGNQYTSNSYIASAIGEPSQLQHPDIVRGWSCVAPDCGYCCSTYRSISHHHYTKHRGTRLSTVPALVLRLPFGKSQNSSFLITQLDVITDNIAEPSNSASQHTSECDDEEDDGEELVLSDYSD